MLRGQLLSLNITLNTSCKLLHSLLCYLWPPLTFGTSADCRNSVLWSLRTSIRKGKAHKLKPMSSNPPPSCLVPRLSYTLPLSSAFVGVHWRNCFWQVCTWYEGREPHKSCEATSKSTVFRTSWLPRNQVDDSCTLYVYRLCRLYTA